MSANDDTYTYDSRGNITSKTVGNTVTNFTYANTGWKDLLVSVDDTELEYDANGNVILYGDREFTWTYGRSLASVLDGMDEYTYTYDENGIRTSKTVDDVTTYYNTKDGVILSQTDGENTWYFQYDTSGTPLGFVLNGTQYFYITNRMNDVLAITDTNGDIVGNYEYDAWGKVLAADTDLAKQNPLRYRGYYYDNETGYYYLQSRYYDSNICRFINADIPEISQMAKDVPVGTNLFAYCNNDSVNYSDQTGHFRISVGWAAVLINGVILCISIICSYFAKVKSIRFLARISSKFKRIFNTTVKKISYWLSKNLAWVIKKCFRVSIATYRINRAASRISWFINTLIELSPGAIIANLLDRIDKDGKNGQIYW
ncbi:RHS repeat domain-containing protein [Eubacterium sp.]|uniref:RHS repeat domain-containing protein n=1 Tax=Eubacterium sp. TaxID=142586 RepID=UPI003992A0F9